MAAPSTRLPGGQAIGTPTTSPGAAWVRDRAGEHADRSWLVQAVTGMLVLGLVTVHMIANHFVVPEGLRDYAQVVEYLSNPLIVVLEVLFLGTVTWHALLGLRAVIFDLGLSPALERLVTRVLLVVGVLTVGYGLWLTSVIVTSA
jgi:succinate dehydrogenase hydrophobic membrane anchor protein